MWKHETISHHAQRAMEELECARRATSAEAAIAHLSLSELHLGEMRRIRERAPAPVLHLVVG